MARDTRIQKMMADAGIASRRKSEEIIEKRRVLINGRIARLGDKVDVKTDLVTVDGQQVEPAADKKYFIMMYKPRGFITTMSDEKDRKCVADLIANIPARLYPVGRLDKDSEGLLLMTNDGAFANMITHPSGHVSKLYRVTVKPAITEEQITTMSSGMLIEGVQTAPCIIRVTTEEKERTVLEVVLNEGRNRQIRKMCEQLGLEVARLKRTAVGAVKLGMLQPGQYRELTPDEVRRLTAASTKAKERSKSYDRDTTNARPERRRTTAKKTYAKKR